MNLKDTFEDSGFSSASKVVEVYRFHHDGSATFYRLEIAETSTSRYTAVVYREVEDEEEEGSVLTVVTLPWIDEVTTGAALNMALSFLGDRIGGHKKGT
jgi:hypothetical protein